MSAYRIVDGVAQNYGTGPQRKRPTECPVCAAELAWYRSDIPLEEPKLICRSRGIEHYFWRPGDPLPESKDAVLKVGPAERLDIAPVEPELIGYDYQELCAGRLGGALGEMTAAHFPIYAEPPRCAGCQPDQSPMSRGTVLWPCRTAGHALRLMGMEPKDIAITKE